jgi:hypothetical protein
MGSSVAHADSHYFLHLMAFFLSHDPVSATVFLLRLSVTALGGREMAVEDGPDTFGFTVGMRR